ALAEQAVRTCHRRGHARLRERRQGEGELHPRRGVPPRPRPEAGRLEVLPRIPRVEAPDGAVGVRHRRAWDHPRPLLGAGDGADDRGRSPTPPVRSRFVAKKRKSWKPPPQRKPSATPGAPPTK